MQIEAYLKSYLTLLLHKVFLTFVQGKSFKNLKQHSTKMGFQKEKKMKKLNLNKRHLKKVNKYENLKNNNKARLGMSWCSYGHN